MYSRFIKRLIDIVISLLGLIVLSPLFLFSIIWIKADSEGPVFFKQRRVGLHKTEFEILKFRTMRADAPKDVPTHLFKDPEQYITRSGNFLRKTSLDELPQLINILKGDMSIVGPRPALYNQYDLIAERDKYGANDVVPGLTGWAQINGRDELEIKEKALLDGYYAARISFFFDLKCFIKTFAVVIKRKGIHEGSLNTNGKKKILFVTNHSYMLYRFRLELIQKLMEDYEVVLSTPFVGHEDDFKAMGLKCIETKLERRGINPVTDFKLLMDYRKQLKEEKPDLVITFSIKPNVYAGFMAGFMDIPYVAIVQGLGSAFEKPLLARFVTVLYRMALRKSYKVLFENSDDARIFAEKKIVPVSKHVILNGAGINLTYYQYHDYPANEIFHFSYIGRIMKEKGITELFEACELLKDKGYQFVLDLVGFYEDDYKDQVQKLTEKGIIIDHGFQTDPRQFYVLSDCVVMPSYHEGMSNVNLEASAIGRPVITTDIPGCREAVDNNITGYLVAAKDTGSLYSAMEKMLTLPREEREKMGKAARRKMENKFDKMHVVEVTVESLPLV